MTALMPKQVLGGDPPALRFASVLRLKFGA